MNNNESEKTNTRYLVLTNLLIILFIIGLLLVYLKDYNQKLYQQNLNDIGNVNHAAAQIASEMSASHERKLHNIIQYVNKHDFSLEEMMSYINDANADSNVTFQVIGKNYEGYAISKNIKGNYAKVSYTSNDYKKIQKIVDTVQEEPNEIPFSTEFTDNYSGSRSFARYAHFELRTKTGREEYVLMAVYRSSSFINHINMDGGFSGLSTVLINEDGSYVLRNSDYKSENLFTYLYVYNNLNVDEKKHVEKQVLSSDGGTFRYKNSVGEECAYVYGSVPGTNWTCVTCVPLKSFHNTNPDLRFTIMLAVFLFIMMAVNIIYMKKLNNKLKVSAVNANAANEAKTDFLARMSHDIRTPINVIGGMAELALEEDNSPEVEGYLRNIKSSGKFLLGLVNDVLDMNKVESGKMELHEKPYSSKEFMAYINAVIVPLCQEKRVEFVMSEEDEVTIVADVLRLNQIFFNLLSNAVKFTEEGGKITFRWKAEQMSEHHVGFDFEIRDNGVGMSQEFQEKMFDAFAQEERTAQDNKNGTGLGLAIVRKLVELMNGNIRVESKEGQGTAFYIRLDFDTVENESMMVSKKTSLTSIEGKRILLCEDHPLNAEIVVRLLSHKNVEVDVAENGEIGVQRFIESSENYYDAILMDVRMPIMNGIEATKAIRKQESRADAKTITIIALTANAYDTDVEACLKAGMNTHLAKPIEPQVLFDTLGEWMK